MAARTMMARQQRLGRDLDGEEEGEREGYGVLGFVYRDGGSYPTQGCRRMIDTATSAAMEAWMCAMARPCLLLCTV